MIDSENRETNCGLEQAEAALRRARHLDLPEPYLYYFAALRCRWDRGHRDSETARRLMFAAWMCSVESQSRTSSELDAPRYFGDALVSLGGPAAADPETLSILTLMLGIGPWIVNDGVRVQHLARERLGKAGFAAHQFSSNDEYGRYFSGVADP